MKILQEAEERAKKRLIKARGGSLGDIGQDAIDRELFISPSEGNRIRSMLADMEYTGVSGVDFSRLRKEDEVLGF